MILPTTTKTRRTITETNEPNNNHYPRHRDDLDRLRTNLVGAGRFTMMRLLMPETEVELRHLIEDIRRLIAVLIEMAERKADK